MLRTGHDCIINSKMAAALSRVGELDSLKHTGSDIIQQSSCNYCLKYKCELQELTQELLSAKKIIQLLQEDNSISKDSTIARTLDDRSNTHVSSNLSSDWEVVTNKSRNPKRLKRIPHDQLPIPVIHLTNRYNTLHNLQNDTDTRFQTFAVI